MEHTDEEANGDQGDEGGRGDVNGAIEASAPTKKGRKRKRFQPPTCDEMIVLKETENTYSSYLVKEQLKSILESIGIAKEVRLGLKTILGEIRSLIKQMEPKLLKGEDFRHSPLRNTSVRCSFEQPLMNVIGSFAHGTLVSREVVQVILSLEVPKEVIGSKDLRDGKVMDKLTLYLSAIGEHISSAGKTSFESISWTHASWEDPIFSVLSIRSSVGGHACEVLVVPMVPEGKFRLSRLRVDTENIMEQTAVFSDDKDGSVSGVSEASSLYNSLVAYRMLYKRHLVYVQSAISEVEELAGAVMLLETWFIKRKALFYLDSHACAMLCAHLYHSGRISRSVKSLQIFRTVIELLATTPLNESGLVLSSNQETNSEEAHEMLRLALSSFEVVILDHTGYINLSAKMLAGEADILRMHAQHTITSLGEVKPDCLEQVFYTEYPFCTSGDLMITMEIPRDTKKGGSTSIYGSKRATNEQILVQNTVSELSRGFGYSVGVEKIIFSRRRDVGWSFGAKNEKKERNYTFALSYGGVPASNIIQGPPIEETEAVEQFREYWGEMAENRRFKDGRILVCVNLSSKSREHFSERLAEVVLKRRIPAEFKILSVDEVLRRCIGGSSLERGLALNRSMANLEKTLRALSDVLPLQIKSIYGVDEAFRYTAVDLKVRGTKEDPLRIMAQLQRSNAWTKEPEVIENLKTGFLLAISDHLRSKHKIESQMYSTHQLDISYARLTFRLVLFVDEDRGKTHDATMSSSLHGFAGRHSCFGDSVRLFKRFLEVSFMASFIHPYAVELLVAAAFHSMPSVKVRSPLVGFFRTLALLSRHKWDTFPLLLDLKDHSSEDERSSENARDYFYSNPSDRPLMFIGSEVDPTSFYTRQTPEPHELNILQQRAKKCIQMIETQAEGYQIDVSLIFNPDIRSAMDMTIILKKNVVSRRMGDVRMFLEELKKRFSTFANFFWDSSSLSAKRNCIFVKWKPSAFLPSEFSPLHSAYGCPVIPVDKVTKKISVIPDVFALLEDIQTLGDGILRLILPMTGVILN